MESQDDLEFALELFDKNLSGTLQAFLVEKPKKEPEPKPAPAPATTKMATAAASKQTSPVVHVSAPKQKLSAHDLTKDITLRILGYLANPKDLAHASMTCKAWSKYLDEDQSLWKSLFQKLHKEKTKAAPAAPSSAAAAPAAASSSLQGTAPLESRPRRGSNRGGGASGTHYHYTNHLSLSLSLSLFSLFSLFSLSHTIFGE